MLDEQEIVVETPEATQPTEVEIAEELSGEDKKEEQLDPGQQEGKKFSPDQSNVPPKRFEEVYGKWKGTERKLNELSENLKTKDVVIEEARKHNQALMEKLEKLSSKAIEAVENVKEQPEAAQGDPPEVAAARSALEDLEARKEAALDRLESKEVIKLDKEIRKVERFLEGYEAFMARKRSEARSKKEKPQENKTQGEELDPDIDAFIKESPWFNQDPIMTGAAKEYDLYLTVQKEWKNAPLSKRLKEVKRVIEERFGTPAGGNGNEPKRTRSSGAESGLGLSRAPSGPKTMKLNEQQLAVAKGLGITPEDYAKQLNFLGGAAV